MRNLINVLNDVKNSLFSDHLLDLFIVVYFFSGVVIIFVFLDPVSIIVFIVYIIGLLSLLKIRRNAENE